MDKRVAIHLLKIPHGKYGPATDLNKMRFWQLPTNYTHRLMFLERHGSEKQNASPHQPQAELCKTLFSSSTHHSAAGIPAPLPLIHEDAYAGVGKGATKNFFMKKNKKKKKSSPIPETPLLWACGVHNRWQREPSRAWL